MTVANPSPDVRRVEAALAGDAEAVGRLYSEHVGPLYDFVYWRVDRSPAAAEEIVQDVFVDAFRNLSTYRGEGTFLGWLVAIARRALVRHWRRKREPAVEALLEAVEAGEPAPDEVLAAEEVGVRISAALSSLPPHWQSLLLGKYREGRSAAELAEAAGTTVAAVNSALQRARAAFGRAVVQACRDVLDPELLELIGAER